MKAKDPVDIQRMFGQIAPRYDFLNHFLSASIDKRWRWRAVEKVREMLAANGAAICVDLCSGTGDLALELHRRLKFPVVASDFCHPMLTRSNAKISRTGFQSGIQTIEADALSLPFPSAVFDAATNAFGLRNLIDTRGGLAEALRILKPGGIVVILEFSRPVLPIFRGVFNFYFRKVLPFVGALVSRQGFAYQYLPDSVQKFPSQVELTEMLRSVGFVETGYRNLSGGIAALHWGRKPWGPPGEEPQGCNSKSIPVRIP
jgi:demethylmenaquinone methyltransferase / 2-methoxy-6-polyprenyl-1,4-benzoquinol methylase